MSKVNELKDFYAGCLMAEAGEHLFFYTDDVEKEIVLQLNKIVSDIRQNHRDKISVNLNQGNNTIKFIKKQDPNFVIPKVKIEEEEVKIVDWGFPEKTSEVSEDCEDGCEGNCPEAFEGDNLT
jgi:hypothetical protein